MAETDDLRDLLMFTDEQCEEMLRVALECHAEGQLAHAETILVGLMALSERDARPIKLLGSTLQLQGKHQQAERVYERAFKLDPKDPYILVALGEIKLKSLKIEEAIPIFERLFELDPQGTHPAVNRGRDLVQTYYRQLAQTEGAKR